MEQPLPLYLAYPFLLPFNQRQEEEKDLQLMQSYYPRHVTRIQEKVEAESDRLEYDGSMMFDEYPDRFMMEHLCAKIGRELKDEKEKEENSDLIKVILFNEMFRRRQRRRERRRYF